MRPPALPFEFCESPPGLGLSLGGTWTVLSPLTLTSWHWLFSVKTAVNLGFELALRKWVRRCMDKRSWRTKNDFFFNFFFILVINTVETGISLVSVSQPSLKYRGGW